MFWQSSDDGELKTEKQARMSKMESLMKEMEGLMKQDGKACSLLICVLHCLPFTQILHMLHCCSCPYCRTEFSDTSGWVLLPKM